MVKSTAAAPAMSPFISHMWSPGFRLMPPESKVMPLPTRAIVSVDGLARHVAQDDHARRVGAALAHAQAALVAARLEARGVEDLDLEADLLGDLAPRGRRCTPGVHHGARLVDEVAAPVHVLGDPGVARLARLGVGLVVGVGEDQ